MMLRVCSIFNILVGLIAVLLCVGASVLAIRLSGGSSLDAIIDASLVMGPIGVAGVLYCWSGVVLWQSLPAVGKRSVHLVGMSWGCGLVYCVTWFVMLRDKFSVGGAQRQPGVAYDEEVVMFVLVPAAVLLLMAIEGVLLWRTMKRQGAASDS